MLETILALLVITNIAGLIPIKLDSNNYLMWRFFFLPILRNHKLMSIINVSIIAPPKTILEYNKIIVNIV